MTTLQGTRMREPRVISTLVEAAKWMTEATGTEWTSESLLDYIYRKMEDAFNQWEDAMGEGDDLEWKREGAYLRSGCLHIALSPTTRVLRVCGICNSGKRLLRECERGQTPLLRMQNHAPVFALLAHGAIELPYPLIDEHCEEDDETYWIDAKTAPIITQESLRIHESDLCVLAEIFNEQNKQVAMPRSIDVLDLTIRSKNCLLNSKINTIEELTKCNRNDLLKMPHLGLRSMNEIRRALALRDLKISDEEFDIETLVNLELESRI